MLRTDVTRREIIQRGINVPYVREEDFLAIENKRVLNQNIADAKSESIAIVAHKFTGSMAQGTVRVLPGAKPIVRKQRVTW